MEHFGIIVNGWKQLTIIAKHSILDVAAVLDPPVTILSDFLIFQSDLFYSIIIEEKKMFL